MYFLVGRSRLPPPKVNRFAAANLKRSREAARAPDSLRLGEIRIPIRKGSRADPRVLLVPVLLSPFSVAPVESDRLDY